MKSSSFFGGVFALSLGWFVAAGTTGAVAQRTADLGAVHADQAMTRAFQEGNQAGAGQALDEEFTWIDSRGKRLGREETLKTLPKMANSDVAPEVRLYGNVMVVKADRDRVHVLRVWVKRAPGWRAVLYQEVRQVEKSESPAVRESGAGAQECANPCQTIPFQPETPSERDAIVSWQGVMRAMAENNVDAYAPLIATEFTATDTHHDRPYTKSDRLAQIRKQKQSGAHANPPALVSAKMFDFGETVMMIAREQRPGAKSYFNTRMWVKRDGHWQMLFSFNTRIE